TRLLTHARQSRQLHACERRESRADVLSQLARAPAQRAERANPHSGSRSFLCERRLSRRVPSAQDRAALSWTSERADTLFRLRVSEEGSDFEARSSRAERAIQHCASRPKQN